MSFNSHCVAMLKPPESLCAKDEGVTLRKIEARSHKAARAKTQLLAHAFFNDTPEISVGLEKRVKGKERGRRATIGRQRIKASQSAADSIRASAKQTTASSRMCAP